jgi:2-hydroxy-3-keto-5-methylthiopentenyl-1-phosphate phosphatase
MKHDVVFAKYSVTNHCRQEQERNAKESPFKDFTDTQEQVSEAESNQE